MSAGVGYPMEARHAASAASRRPKQAARHSAEPAAMRFGSLAAVSLATVLDTQYSLFA
jgi:hypothetical protein